MESNSNSAVSPDGLSLRGLLDDPDRLAEAVVDTVRDCLIILDGTLRVCAANRNFFLSFEVTPEDTIGHSLFELGDGQWNIPDLRRLLHKVLPQNNSFRDFEVNHTFPHLGRKTMLLNARKLLRRDSGSELILLAIEDVTERKRLEMELRDRERALAQVVKDKELLIAEVHHRVKNILQAVVSLLNLHATHTTDPRVIEALSDAGGRVKVIARLHETLYASSDLTKINFGEYLRHLANELRTVHGRPEVSFEIDAGDVVLDMETAVPLGLIANELIINSLKHAFPSGRAGQVRAAIEYVYDSVPPGEPLDDALIRLRVEDDGIGLPSGLIPGETNTLGLKIVKLLSKQLDAHVHFRSVDGVQTRLTFKP